MLQDKPDLAALKSQPQVRRTGGTAPERDLLAEVIGRLATRYITAGDQSAAEVAWSTAVVPCRGNPRIGLPIRRRFSQLCRKSA